MVGRQSDRAGKYPDPFFGIPEAKAPLWISAVIWAYRIML